MESISRTKTVQVYWAGPILGGVAAALIYQLLLAVSGNFETLMLSKNICSSLMMTGTRETRWEGRVQCRWDEGQGRGLNSRGFGCPALFKFLIKLPQLLIEWKTDWFYIAPGFSTSVLRTQICKINLTRVICLTSFLYHTSSKIVTNLIRVKLPTECCLSHGAQAQSSVVQNFFIDIFIAQSSDQQIL